MFHKNNANFSHNADFMHKVVIEITGIVVDCADFGYEVIEAETM